VLLWWTTLTVARAAEPLALPASVETLDNGLTVILLEDHRTDTVALHLSFGVGSRDERQGERGCAHLFEHLMFEGSRNVPQDKFDEWLSAAGGDNNAWTSEDETAYFMNFPSGAMDVALFLESDRVGFLDAGLVQGNLENQQRVVLQERAESYAEPNGRDQDSLSRLFWPESHPYHHPVIGTVADIEGFQLDAVKSFWEDHYRPRNAVLALVGNFDKARALEQVKWWFSDVPDRGPPLDRGPKTLPAQITPESTRQRAGVVEDDVEERTLYLAWPTVDELHADVPALELLSYILSGGQGTRLDGPLYFESKLASDVGAYHGPSDLAGQFVIYVSSPSTPLLKLQSRVDKQVQALIKKPPTQAEVDRARLQIRGYVLDILERPGLKAQVLVDCFRQKGTPDCLQEEDARYRAVTPADIQRVAAQYLSPGPVTLSIVPRKDSASALPGSVPVELP
jgi:zinc protease